MRIFKQIYTVEDWLRLAPPARGKAHWKDGRSAKELAKAWCERGSGPEVPRELQEFLNTHPDIAGAEILEAIPEHKVKFDDIRGEPRNADLVCIAQCDGQRIAISIEAKADEPFGELVAEVLHTPKKASRRPERLQKLCQALFGRQVEDLPEIGALRYQLFHAVGAAIAFAVQVQASRVVFIVHEFETDKTRKNLLDANQVDFHNFLNFLAPEAVPIGDCLYGPIRVPGNSHIPSHIPLYIGKLRSVTKGGKT
jgi:hypothetical protein